MRTIDIDLQSNSVTILPDGDREIDLAGIPRVIEQAGFQPGVATIRARGTLEGTDPPCFRVRGWGRCLPIAGPVPGNGAGELTVEAEVELRGGRTMLSAVREFGSQ